MSSVPATTGHSELVTAGSPAACWSKLAVASLLLSPVPLVAAAILLVVMLPELGQAMETKREGWDRFGDTLGGAMLAYCLLIGVTFYAAANIALAAGGLWKTRRRRQGGAMRGEGMAWTAILISAVTWAVLTSTTVVGFVYLLTLNTR